MSYFRPTTTEFLTTLARQGRMLTLRGMGKDRRADSFWLRLGEVTLRMGEGVSSEIRVLARDDEGFRNGPLFLDQRQVRLVEGRGYFDIRDEETNQTIAILYLYTGVCADGSSYQNDMISLTDVGQTLMRFPRVGDPVDLVVLAQMP